MHLDAAKHVYSFVGTFHKDIFQDCQAISNANGAAAISAVKGGDALFVLPTFPYAYLGMIRNLHNMWGSHDVGSD